MILNSLRGVLALGGLHAGDGLAMGGDPVVGLGVGVVQHVLGPGVAGNVVQVLIEAEQALADLDEVSLEQGPVHGDQIPCVSWGS